jgi:hypothetical protein
MEINPNMNIYLANPMINFDEIKERSRVLNFIARIAVNVETFICKFDNEERKRERKKFLEENKNLEWSQNASQVLKFKNAKYEEEKLLALTDSKLPKDIFDKFQKIILPVEIEMEMFKNFKIFPFGDKFPQDELVRKYPCEIVKEAYFFHSEQILASLENFTTSKTESENKVKLLLERLRVDDELYFNYNLTYTQLKFLMHLHELFTDPEVLEIYSIIPS